MSFNTMDLLDNNKDNITIQESREPEKAEGLKVNRKEKKSEHVQLLFRPTTKKMIKEMADREEISMNELISNILEDWLKRRYK